MNVSLCVWWTPGRIANAYAGANRDPNNGKKERKKEGKRERKKEGKRERKKERMKERE